MFAVTISAEGRPAAEMDCFAKEVDMVIRKKPNVCSLFSFFVVATCYVVDRDLQGAEGFFTDAKNVGQSSWTFAVSQDGLELFFTGSCGGPGGPRFGFDICTATRATTDEPFGNIKLVENASSTAEEEVGALSDDGTTLLFVSNRTGNGSQGSWDLWMATRAHATEPFQNVRNLGPGVNSNGVETAPSLSRDGLTLYFTRLDLTDLYVATRTATHEMFANPVPLDPINLPVIREYSPSISRDELTLFFSDFPGREARPGGQGSADIWVSTRPNPFARFSNPLNLNDFCLGSQVNTPGVEGLPEISSDWPAPGSKLYYWEQGGIRQVTWVPDCNRNRMDDVEEIAAGLALDVDGNAVPDECESVRPFLRSDCNDDGTVDISDAVCILNWLFLGGATPGCIAVTNTNGDAGEDISDATYLLNHLFLGGPAPVDPYPDCGPGTLPTDESTCETPPKHCEQ